MWARTVCGFVALLVIAAIAPAAASATPTGAIEGTVTGSDTHSGIEGIEVCATRYEGAFLESCELTAADGTYAIEGLPAGEYEVSFWAEGSGYGTRFYPGAVTVGSEPVTGIDIELDPVATIAGTVTRSSDGAPVEEVLVCALSLTSQESGRCTVTQADGSYAMEEIESGDYAVEFWPGFSGQNLAYQFYDHRNHFPEADHISIEVGDQVNGVDGVLGPGGTISGHVYSAATGSALEEIYVCAIDTADNELVVCSLTGPGGAYQLPILPAGSYKVVFSIDFEEWYEEEFGEEEVENDGYPTQFWNGQTTLAAADAITLATGQSVGGVDAHLGPAPPAVITPPAPVVTPPVVPPTAHVVRPHPHCRKGFKRKKVKGKYRCVRRKKHHYRRHRSSRLVVSRSAGAASVSPFEAGERDPRRQQFRVR